MKQRLTAPAEWELDELSRGQRKEYEKLSLELVKDGVPEEESRRRAFITVLTGAAGRLLFADSRKNPAYG